jgi:hypothetical protein
MWYVLEPEENRTAFVPFGETAKLSKYLLPLYATRPIESGFDVVRSQIIQELL